MSLDRDLVLSRLREDLIGPREPTEVLRDKPSDVYLSGIIWPRDTNVSHEELERLGAGADDGHEGGEEDEVPLFAAMRPCVAGLSFALGGKCTINVRFQAGIYRPIENERGVPSWQRIQVELSVDDLDCTKSYFAHKLTATNLPSGISLVVRAAPWTGTSSRLVTLTLVNEATPAERGRAALEAVTLFQTSLNVTPGNGSSLPARPSRRVPIDADDRSAALLYRSAREFAVGHTCSATWCNKDADTAEMVRTEWIPEAVVPAVRAEGHIEFDKLKEGPLFPLDAEWLANTDDKTLRAALLRLPKVYRSWLSLTEMEANKITDAGDQQSAAINLAACSKVAERLENSARRISGDPVLAASFRLANCAMVEQARWAGREKLVWRPFQLGFFLLAAVSAIDENDSQRLTMDLLWFPTGGGKTEAYLGVIAFVAFARRLRSKGQGHGVASIMRYTLRLLTTQQFSRSAALILACEGIRRGKIACRDSIKQLGSQPFGIGLWVGGEATPNRLDQAAQNLGRKGVASPVQLVDCPACSKPLDWSIRRSQGTPVSVDVRCKNRNCILHDPKLPLPVHTVDADIYRERPTLLIGTVDKFAQIVRRPEVRDLFDVDGPNGPDLVIQDELHLISGPLGTMVGLYEAGIDRLMWRDGRPPKVIGSTATIRRADQQVTALFNRTVCQFPPPAIDASDSGFAVIDPKEPGRLYAAVTTAGRSAKFTLQAVSGSLLQTSSAAFSDDERRDPYWTLVAYFNSLRELGGAYVLMQDDVPNAIKLYATARKEHERNATVIEELTSRRSQDEVRDMLKLMDLKAGKDGALDALLASNMLSVGVDIQRLGLMVVNGQPKGISEYIQATSRVGRRHPGLVVALLNNAKARDRSHYETFRTWHSTLYRDVEATSVTPFASRARDRALHAALIAAARHLIPALSTSPKLNQQSLLAVRKLIDEIVARAHNIDPSETSVRQELEAFVAQWRARGPTYWWNDSAPGRSLLISAEAAATLRAQNLDPRGAQSTPNSMRNVEPGVPFRLVQRLSRNRK